jgi:nucleoside 2-deoxyribosyltransferase
MKTIYFAGPDVFKSDYSKLKPEINAMCVASGLTPLLPGDLELPTSEAIFRYNLFLIDQADGVIANLNPFRGVIEPDSGTVFECAYAYAKGKIVIGYLEDRRDILTKLRQTEIGPPADGVICQDGTWVEDFKLPLNLMLAHSLKAVLGSLKEAVHLAASYQNTGE